MNKPKTIIVQCGPAAQVFAWFALLVAKSPNLTLGEMAELREKISK